MVMLIASLSTARPARGSARVVRDGSVPGVDTEVMRARAQEFFDAYRASFPARDHLLRPVDVLMPPSFPYATGAVPITRGRPAT
jgi:hypothetical protein